MSAISERKRFARRLKYPKCAFAADLIEDIFSHPRLNLRLSIINDKTVDVSLRWDIVSMTREPSTSLVYGKMTTRYFRRLKEMLHDNNERKYYTTVEAMEYGVRYTIQVRVLVRE